MEIISGKDEFDSNFCLGKNFESQKVLTRKKESLLFLENL